MLSIITTFEMTSIMKAKASYLLNVILKTLVKLLSTYSQHSSKSRERNSYKPYPHCTCELQGNLTFGVMEMTDAKLL